MFRLGLLMMFLLPGGIGAGTLGGLHPLKPLTGWFMSRVSEQPIRTKAQVRVIEVLYWVVQVEGALLNHQRHICEYIQQWEDPRL